ncbi:AAA family ATPase [Leucothrix pacifica]|uniref:ATPase n=1 Tax=Leucothrix pacifica TaxID=1247513 RepID=A0A317CL80_9GAMM|nr:ATP-binding protein [Leucothrix pacifica]PWQ97090.1 ATPase [Leucothrix pacifica]
MIKELRLKNWKSFDEATLYIDPLTIIIGTNVSGKSNALDALTFLHRISRGVTFAQAINGDLSFPALRGGMEWVCLQPHKQFALEVITDGNGDYDEYHYCLEVQTQGAKAFVTNESLKAVILSDAGTETTREKTLFKTPDTLVNDSKIAVVEIPRSAVTSSALKLTTSYSANTIFLLQAELMEPEDDEVTHAMKHVLTQFRGIFIFDPIPSHMRDYSPLSDKLASDGSNIAGVLADLEASKKQSIEQTLTQYLKALPERDIQKVWTEKIGRSATDAMLYCEEAWSKDTAHEIDARGMSDGTLRYLGILTALLTRDSGSLLVIEEVDNALHPSRAQALLDMLRTLGKQRGIDILVTTHNPALLDAAGVPMLPFITVAHRDTESGCSELKPLEDLEQLPKLLAGGSLGKLSSAGRIESALKLEDQQ